MKATTKDKLQQIPSSVLEALQERGHSDETISNMKPQTMFNEYCEWNGLIGYGRSLWNLVIDLQKLN